MAVVRDARLREFDFGEWEGLRWDEIVARWPELVDQGPTAARLYRPEGGESFEDVVARVRAFLDDMPTQPGEHIVAVAHAGVFHALLEALGPSLEGGPADGLAVNFQQASISRIAMEGGRARLISLSDVTHLNPIT